MRLLTCDGKFAFHVSLHQPVRWFEYPKIRSIDSGRMPGSPGHTLIEACGSGHAGFAAGRQPGFRTDKVQQPGLALVC